MTNVRYQNIQMYKLLDFINLNNLTKVFIDCQDHVKIKNDKKNVSISRFDYSNENKPFHSR